MGFGNPTPGTLGVDFAGNHDLTGAGVLFYLQFTASSTTSGSSSLAFTSALFNEVLPAVTVNGLVSVLAPGTIFVNPDQVTLLTGQTQAFTVTGSPTPPLSWSVVDPSIASISAGGVLTALRGGDTQVRVEDSIGAVDYNLAVHIYDFRVTVGTVAAPPGATVRIPLDADRFVGALDIYSLQYTLAWTGTAITDARATNSGLAGIWGPTGVVDLLATPRINVAAAGTSTLDASGKEIHALEFDLSPSATPGTNIPLTLTPLLFNEGSPRALITNGVLQVRTTVDAPGRGAPASFALWPCEPNPARRSGVLRFDLPTSLADSRVRLALYSADGRRVRTLHDGALGAGAHALVWDLLGDDGGPVAAGLYFCRLDVGGRALVRKLAVTR